MIGNEKGEQKQNFIQGFKKEPINKKQQLEKFR